MQGSVFLRGLFWGFFFTGAALATDQNLTDTYFGGRLNESLYDTAFSAESSGIQSEKPTTWEEKEILDIFPELRILDDISQKKSLERLNQARQHHNEALHILAEARQAAEKAGLEAQMQKFQWEWQKREHESQVKQEQHRRDSRARQQAVSRLILAMQAMDSVRNPAQQSSPAMLDLRSNIYRKYIQLQFASRNLKPTVSVLQQYIALSPEHAAEAEPHRLLAATYRHQEIMAGKMRNRKEELHFKRLKHTHLLKYAELAFGSTSSQYNLVARQAQKDLTETLP